MQLIITGITYALVAAASLAVGLRLRKDKTQATQSLSLFAILAAAVNVLYFISILTKDYTLGPTLGVCVFALTDVVVFVLLCFLFAYIYRRLQRRPAIEATLRVIAILVVADVISMLLNPVFGHVARYYYINKNLPPHFIFNAHAGYYLHLALIYSMLIYGFLGLVARIVRIPSIYRSPYYKIVACIVATVAVTLFFFFNYIEEGIDYTILAYGLLSILIYQFGFIQGKNGALEKTGYAIINSSTQPVVVFDNMSELFFVNRAAQELFPGITETEDPMTYDQFMDILNLDGLPRFKDNRRRFYWTPAGVGDFSYICDYLEVSDKNNNRVARAIVFTNNTLSMDPQTGFLTEQYFSQHASELTDFDVAPVAVAICDLNQLGLINNVLGYARGDEAIELQAQLMRKHLPGRTIFVRLHDAKLGALCYGMPFEEIKTRLGFVNSELATYKDWSIALKIDFAICELLHDESIEEAAARATAILKTRKLLDASSGHSEMLESLTQMIYEVDPGTEAHVRRTRVLGEGLAFELGLSDYERDQLSLLCLFHDIGKVGIPVSILRKPSKLTDEEAAVMREHVQKGYRIARATSGLEIVAEPILHHHEHWDGKGYPDGLQHEAIPILSRIIAVIDSYDAMVSDRPYHKGISVEEACSELVRCAGTQFDPYIVDAFVHMVTKAGALAQGSQGEPNEAQGVTPEHPSHTDEASLQYQIDLERNRAKMNMRRLESKILLDPMTGLLNKEAFKQGCERELIDANQHCVLVMMDMDNFKNFNDTYGHPAGDELLVSFAHILASSVRNDELAGRMGGDEFCCLLRFRATTPKADIAMTTSKVWQRIVAAFEQVENAPSLSAGVAILPAGESDFSKLYNAADERLYQAKRAGKNRLVNFTDES